MLFYLEYMKERHSCRDKLWFCNRYDSRQGVFVILQNQEIPLEECFS